MGFTCVSKIFEGCRNLKLSKEHAFKTIEKEFKFIRSGLSKGVVMLGVAPTTFNKIKTL